MKTKKAEISFDAGALVARVEGFAAGRQPARERTMKLPPPVKSIPAKQIRAIRLGLGCTQTEFAVLLNVPAITAISWENGTRKPSGAALRLLAVARHHPEALHAAVAARDFFLPPSRSAYDLPATKRQIDLRVLYAGHSDSASGLHSPSTFAKLETISTLHEIKAAAATLPAEERSELATWLSESEDVSKIRRQQLRQEIRIGLDEIERGEVAPLDIAEVKRKARARWETERQG